MNEEFDEYEIKKKIDLKVWKKVFKEISKAKYRFILASICIAIVAVVETLFSIHIAAGLSHHLPDAVDGVHQMPTAEGIKEFILLFALLVINQSVFVFAFIRLASMLELHFYKRMSSLSFHHLQELSYSFYDKNSVGWLLARVMSDTERLSSIVSWGMIDVVWSICRLGAIVFFLFLRSVPFALGVLAFLPLLVIVSTLFRGVIVTISRKVRKINSEIVGRLNEGIMGAKTTKSLVLEQKYEKEFADATARYKKISLKSALFNSLYFQIIAISTGFAIALTGYLGGRISILGLGLTFDALYLFMDFMRSFFEPVLNFAAISNEMKHAQVAAERLFNLIDVKPSITDSEEVIAIYGNNIEMKKENWEEIEGNIEFDSVSFLYNPDSEKILDDFTLSVKSGESVAIVGETGAGKSTIVNLMCRFYEPTQGMIKIDGKDYKARSMAWLHSRLGYVKQSPHLFSGSILDNIRYGKLDATLEEVQEVAKLVDAHDFIMNMEKGYDSEVGEGGNKLSMGQRQLISFARAIIGNPRILVLDEATSSIDAETEMIIQKAVNNLLIGRTSVIIAHRLSTITGVDKIIVLRKGKIIESGSHKQLLEKKGYYYELYSNQYIDESFKKIS